MALFTVDTPKGEVKVEGGYANVLPDSTLMILSQSQVHSDPLRGIAGGVLAAFAPGHWTQVTQTPTVEGVKK